MKSKFRFIYKSGFKMLDRNRYKTLSQAKSWAKASNKYSKDKDRIIKVEKYTPKKRVKRKSYKIF